MAMLIEKPEQHLTFLIGSLTAQNVSLQCAVEERDRTIEELRDRIALMQARVSELEGVPAEAGAEAPAAP